MILKGVNLGGWLVLERWITPSLFESLKAEDETSLCLELGEAKIERLARHRQTFITEDDFKWIASHGLNSVRIPVPHWLFGGIEPYVGGAEFLDLAMDWAAKHELKVILDIHTAPGSQNGRAHSGLTGQVNWPKDRQNITQSLEFLERLCQHYGRHEALFGIELLNEPRGLINPLTLKKYYTGGYEIVRKYCGAGTTVIISDYYAPWRWQKFMPDPRFKNIIRDTHLYQAHRAADKKLTMEQHVKKASIDWSKLVANLQKRKQVIIGEWSLALAPETFAGMSQEEKLAGIMAYAKAQVKAFASTSGWFYWTYKTEQDSLWNLRHCVESGLLKI